MDPSSSANAVQDNEQDDAKSSLKELYDHLDSLWITYLTQLDAYAAAQKLLQKHMSAGFLALARANFNARNGVRRYGQDYYHDRPIASCRTTVSTEEGDSRPSIEIIHWSLPTAESEEGSEAVVKVEKTGEEDEDVTQLPSPPGTPEPEPQSEPNRSDSNNLPTPTKTTPGKIPLGADPLKWFGILIPQALRSSQASFSAALQEGLSDAVNSAKSMRRTEAVIRKLRKEIRRIEKRDLVQE
jgi:hypothetical protein